MARQDDEKARRAALVRIVKQANDGARVRFVGSTPVHEQFQGVTVWRGLVSEFSIGETQPRRQCYAWREPPEMHGGVETFRIVQRTPEVDSPEKAVRAAIVADHRKG
jgi:molybdopterin synthase catalytic subunit